MLLRLVVVALVYFPLSAAQTLQWWQWYQGLCPIGQVAHIDPLQNRPSLCSSFSQVCPVGYACRRGSGTNQATSLLVCCAPSGTCSTGGQIYRDVTGAIPSCAPNAQGNCPPSYTCAAATTSLGQYLCCGGGIGQVGTCPNGSPSSGFCSLSQPFSCQNGFTCQQTATGAACCSSIGGSSCPGGGVAVPAQCFAPGTQCQVGYTCQQGLTGQLACCPSTSVGTCPTGGAPIPAQCFAPGTQCQVGYTCQQGLTGQLACCPSTTISTCPSGGAPIQAQCFQPGTPCQTGYTCQQTATGIACCPSGIVGGLSCPAGYTAAISAVDGTPRTCLGLIDLTCPFGYSCLQSTVPSSYLCCQLGGIGKRR
uniref:Uncharacterized protein n=1 Tax=Plectus sambesii TaxID=2011161 RepID=A0A914W2E4_9BILA